MRTTRTVAAALLALVALGQHVSAQSLTLSLFERYLESLRLESGIPGLSAAIVENGRVVWDAGFGFQNVESAQRAQADTPYPIADLSQTVFSTLLLQRCVDSGRLEVSDRVRRWVDRYPDDTTVGQLLRHASPSGAFKYDPARFADLTGVVEQCTSAGFGKYGRVLTDEILDPLAMRDSVPGQDLGDPASPNRSLHEADALARYAGVLRRLAVPYRLDANRRPIRSSYPTRSLSASTGIVSTARDIARFDANLGVLVTAETLRAAWSTAGAMPTGLGWFVQKYNNDTLVWHFGLVENASSSLVLKVPGRGLTLVLLANSDGLSAPFPLAGGDVTTSLFAKLFLRLFLA